MSLRKGIKLEVKTLLRSKNVYILCGTLALLYCIIMLIKMKTYDFMNGLFASHGNHVFLCTIKDVISSSIGVVMAWYIGGNITKDFKYQMTYYFKSLGNYSKKILEKAISSSIVFNIVFWSISILMFVFVIVAFPQYNALNCSLLDCILDYTIAIILINVLFVIWTLIVLILSICYKRLSDIINTVLIVAVLYELFGNIVVLGDWLERFLWFFEFNFIGQLVNPTANKLDVIWDMIGKSIITVALGVVILLFLLYKDKLFFKIKRKLSFKRT